MELKRLEDEIKRRVKEGKKALRELDEKWEVCCCNLQVFDYC